MISVYCFVFVQETADNTEPGEKKPGSGDHGVSGGVAMDPHGPASGGNGSTSAGPGAGASSGQYRRDGPTSLDVPSGANSYSLFGGGGKSQGHHALTRSKSLNRQRLVAHSTAMESIQAQSEPIDEDDNVP